MPDSPLLELHNAAKAFGVRLLFKNVSLTLHSHTLYLLTGRNGSGKSTLMRIMAGLLSPDSGKVIHHIEDGKIGYMAHTPFLYPDLTAMENLIFWAKGYSLKNPEKNAEESLKKVGLSRYAHDSAGIFSRGMAQRLNLARLMLNNPELILLDEPTTGLDTPSRSALMENMLEAKQNGSAIVWISHDIEEDSRHADALLELNNHSVTEERKIPC